MDPPGSDAIRTSYPVFLQKGSFFQPSGFPQAIGDPIASPMARGPKPNRHLCWRPPERASGHCGRNSGFAQTAVIRRRFAEQVNSTCVTAHKADTRAATAGKIFANVDPNVEGGDNVSFSLKHQLPVSS
jgi:hypothetical protein